ncbi:cohesin domain-containing protein [Chloroflexota bacterium]
MAAIVRILSALFVSVLLLSSSAVVSVAADGETTVSINAPDVVPSGGNFTATVDIDYVEKLNASSFYVSFNPNVLRLDGVTNGQISYTVIPIGLWNEFEPGACAITGDLSGLTGVTGSGYLVKLHFQVIGSPGNSSNIDLSNGVLGDTSGQSIPATWTGDSVRIPEEIELSVILQGVKRPDAGWVVPINIKLFTTGADVLSDNATQAFNLYTAKSNGTAACQFTGVPTGDYDITAVSEHTLMNVRRGVVVSEASSLVDMGNLLEGNANGDDIININDFSILAVSFMKLDGENGYDATADFDRNGIINISDFGLLAINFMKISPVDVTM